MAQNNKKITKPKQLNPAIRLSGLRRQLDAALSVTLSLPDTVAQLDRLTDGLKPTSFLPIVLDAFAAIDDEARQALEPLVIGWLEARSYLTPLLALATQGAANPQVQALALGWLQVAHVDTTALEEAASWNPFYRAYAAGNSSQEAVAVFWYTNAQQRRVRALSFLIDFEPPWEGALKDVAVLSQRAPDEAIADFLDLWRQNGTLPQPLSAAEARERLMKALAQNQAVGIRLAADIVAARELVLRVMQFLPDAGERPFTATDFDLLATTGQRPEAIRLSERRFGYQTRLPDGSIIHVLPDPDL